MPLRALQSVALPAELPRQSSSIFQFTSFNVLSIRRQTLDDFEGIYFLHHVPPSRGDILGQPSFRQQDHPQPTQRLVHLIFLQKTKRRAHISRALSIWEKHGAWEREYATAESLSSYDALRVTILAKQELEPEGGQSIIRGQHLEKAAALPEEHSGIGGVPFREPVEVPLHSRLEHVTLRAIEVRDSACVREEAVAPPCAQEGDDDRLGEGRRLQVRNGRLGGKGRHKTN